MALYLVIHEPTTEPVDGARAPSRLTALARAALEPESSPRWLQTWSPDLNDDRIVSLWEAESGADIQSMLEQFGFLDDMNTTPLRVRQWGPREVLAEESEMAATDSA